MNEVYRIFCFSLISFCFSVSVLTAQDNLSVSFDGPTGVPDFLNICGDPDTEVVQVAIFGASPLPRTGIQATAHLFKGVKLVSFDNISSTTGVNLINNSNPNKPIFSLPDLEPGELENVLIAFSIDANCEYIDTINMNNAADVFDTWEFNYTLGTSPGQQEFDNNTEYRDAFAVPNFTSSLDNSFGKAKVGDCFTRNIEVTSSGLDGFIDTMIYENLQGSGVSLQSITVNGLPLTISKTPSGTDTLITAILDSAYFELNTIGAGPGDGDQFFDPNETATITETICVVSCFESRASIHDMSWGCDGDYCQTTSVSDFVEMGQGAANVVPVEGGTIPDLYAGYCQTGNTTISFHNDGVEIDPGFATMRNLEIGIGLGTFFELSEGGFDIVGIQIAGVPIPAPGPLTMLDGNPLFTTDPDGPGGLSDFDGDGYFDDLMLFDSVEITAFYDFDCSQAQQLGTDETCRNDFRTSFSARVAYDDACNTHINFQESNYLRPSNTRSTEENFTDTDAFALLDTFYVRHTQTRSVRFFEKSCGDNEELLVTVVLPPGINPVISETQLIRNEATNYPLLSNTISNDTLFLVFDASVTPFLNGDYEVILAFQADCSALLGPTFFETEFAFNCPSCSCKHIWWCSELTGPWIHSTDPPCPPVPCDPGVQTIDFQVNRTTFGFTDNTYTTPYDPASANTKAAISCDSIEMRILNIVGEDPVTDSVGMVITYSNVDGTDDPAETFLFDFAAVRITNSGNTYTCNIDATDLSVQAVDSFKILTFDLDDCITGLGGVSLTSGDTIEFIGMFSLNPEGPYPVQFRSVPNLRAYGYATFDGIDYPCDNFGDLLTIAKNLTVYDFPNSSSFPEGCEETYLNYRLVTINNGFADWFGNETRQAVKIDSIVFDFDANILDGFDVFSPEVSIPDHPVHGSAFYPVPGFDSTGHYVASFDTLVSVPSLNNVLSYSFNFRIRVVPNCQSETSSTSGNNAYNFDSRIYFEDRYYASIIGDGSCSDTQIDTVDNDLVYSDPPTFSYVAVSNPNYTLLGDTAVWTIQHCNTSFTADAGVTWLGLEDSTGTIQVVSMEDISDPMNVTDLAVVPYGNNNYFAITPGLDKADGSATLSEICNIIRIKALVNNCGTTNFHTRVGWNCELYSDPQWNPEDYPPCNDHILQHSVTNLDPLLDANIVQQANNPDICDTVTIDVLLRNTDQGRTFDLVTQFILPIQGTTLVPGGVEIAYPSGAPFVPVAADPVYVGTNVKGDIYQYDDFSQLHSYLDQSGLPGFNPVSPTDSNEVILRYRFITDCDFVSGSLSHYTFQGLMGCGDSTNFETGETLPIQLNGATVIPPKLFDVFFVDGSELVSNVPTNISISVVNQETAPSDTTDKVSLRLPLEINYGPGSSLAVQPGNWTIEEPDIDTVSGYQILQWCLPQGIATGDTATFSLDLTAPFYSCDTATLPLELYTVALTQVFCADAGINCDAETVTSSNIGELTELDVLPLQIQPLPDLSACDGTSFSVTAELTENIQTYVISGGVYQNDILTGNILTFDAQYGSDTTFFDVQLTGALNGCTTTESFAILPCACQPPEVVSIAITQTTCGNSDGSVTIHLDQNESDYNFIWSPPLGTPNSIGNRVTDLPFEGYTIQIEHPGFPDCNTTAYAAVTNADGPTATAITTPATCQASDGSATLSPANYTYTWEDTFVGSTRSNLPTGTYFVTLTDPANPGCQNVTAIVIGEDNPLTADVETLLQPDCGVANGSVMVHTLGGSGDYTFSWLDGYTSTDSTRTNLAAGVYNLTITDNGPLGCELPVIFVLIDNVPDGAVTITDTMHVSCPGATDGGVDYNVVYDGAFTPPADTTFTNGYADFTNGQLPPGAYCLVINDGNGCVAGGACFTIEEPDPISLLYVLSPECEVPVTVDLTATGGTTPYIYDWQDLPGAADPEDRTDLVAEEIYNITVTDSNGCELSDNMQAPGCPDCVPPTLNSITIVEADCGESNGLATISLIEEESDYTFIWSPDLGNGNGNTRTGLPFGGYTVQVIDNQYPTCMLEVFVAVTTVGGPTADVQTLPATCQAADGAAVLTPDTYDYIWSDNGQNTAVRNDLPSGTYFVTITDPADPGCSNVMSILIEQDNPLLADAEIATMPDCGMANGEVTLHVSGGSGDYHFYWQDGFDSSDSTRTGLMAGLYVVTIVDNDLTTACELPFIFVLEDNVPPANLTITDTIPVSCFGGNDGGILYDIVFDGAFVGPADTVISDGFQQYTNGQLPAGSYCIVINDGNGCVAGSGCFVIEEPDPLDLLFVVTSDCGGDGTIDVTVTGGAAPYSYDWASLPDSLDTEDLTDLAQGVYDLLVTDSLGCTIQENEVVVPACQDSCELFNGADSVWLQAGYCGGQGAYCFDMTIQEVLALIIYDNGQLYTGTFTGCEFDTLVAYNYAELFGQGTLGPYDMVGWSVDMMSFSGEFADIDALLDSMNVWDPLGNWTFSTQGQYIVGGNSASNYGSMEINAIDFGTTSFLGANFLAEPNSFALDLDEGFHEVIVTDTSINCTDTLYANVVCADPDTIYTQVEVGEVDTLCLDISELAGNLDTMYNICEEGDNAIVNIIEGTNCIEIIGMVVGFDTACIVACDEYGICDTTYVIIEVVPPYDEVSTSVCIDEEGVHCIDTSTLEIVGEVVSMTSVCPGLSGESVSFELDTIGFCVSYVGVAIGIDTACIEFCDAAGNCDTISYFIETDTCSLVTPNVYCDDVFVFQTDTFCLDLSQLAGTPVSIENMCEDEMTGDVDFFLDPISYCVNYTGMFEGQDTACVVVCDEFGICDTTFFCITVELFNDGPFANCDYDTTFIGTPVVIDVISNDTLFDGIDTMYISEQPLYGTAILNLDGSITYNAGEEHCEREDQFTYMVCTPNGCDTACVVVWIECVDIVIFTAVSPNRDGENDFFHIAGIEDFPDNELTIYNRWGNQVFETSGYSNKWAGTWNGDRDLPDGTYFFILKLNDEANRVFRGYIELHR